MEEKQQTEIKPENEANEINGNLQISEDLDTNMDEKPNELKEERNEHETNIDNDNIDNADTANIDNDDEEYKGEKENEDGEEDEDNDDNEEHGDNEDEEHGDNEDEEHVDNEDEEHVDNEDNEEQAEPKSNKRKLPEVKVPKRRGRKKTKFTFLEEGVFDMDGNPINVTKDEVVIDHEDPKGREKVDEDGNLKGGREYLMKTFKVLGSGDKLFMISTEPARLVGFRDSYLLFKTHRSLFKKVCTNEEKMDLIDRGLIPNSYKGRSVNLVAARSIFREFGAKMIRGGRKVVDDFWEQRAIDRGDVSGELVDPSEFLRLPSMPFVDPSVAGGAPTNSAPLVNYQSDKTWLYQIAMRTKEENQKYNESRRVAYNGVRDVFTNLVFYPECTQPTRVEVKRVGDEERSIRCDVVFGGCMRREVTGLGDVPEEVYEGVGEEVRRAIEEQKQFELKQRA